MPSPTALADHLADSLERRIVGTVGLPGSSVYSSAAPWNTAVVFQPAAVVAVADSNDVSAVLRFAAAEGFRVAVQATGHGAVDRDGGTLLIDTSALQRCDIDAERRTAGVGAGVTAARLISAAADHGLAAILGSAGTVGVAGYLSGGGVGPLVSTFGVSSDYIESLEVVTGDGRIRHVSPTEQPNLFWGFRGGRSTLGIITDITLRLVPLARVYGGALWFDGADAAAVLQAWTTWSAEVPEEITTSILLARLPAVGPPPPLAGRFVLAVRVGSVLSPEEAEGLLTPIRAAAATALDGIGVLEYRDIGRIHNEPTEPEPLIQSQALLADFSQDDASSLLAAFTSVEGAPLALTEVRHFGGALARQPEHPSAFSLRSAPYGLTAIGFAPPDRVSQTAAAAEHVIGRLSVLSERQILANFVATSDPTLAARAYDAATHERLQELAREYDPDRVLSSPLT